MQYLQNGTPQLQSGKYFQVIQKRKGHSGENYEAQRRIFKENYVSRSGKHIPAKIPWQNAVFTKRKVLSAPNSLPKRCAFDIFFLFHEPVAFRSENCGAAQFQKSETGYTIEYRVFKKSLKITGCTKIFKNCIRNMKSTFFYSPMGLSHNFFRESVPIQ